MAAISDSEHWDRAYALGDTDRGWYQPVASVSMRLVEQFCADKQARLLDVGGGASVFVDGLLHVGYRHVSILDQSDVGLQIARDRLGEHAHEVEWITADLRSWSPPECYDVWHDRAVLHFLIHAADRERYVSTLRSATKIGSVVIIGVFSPNGPTMCAGLPVHRYSAEDVAHLLGTEFTVVHHEELSHVRPDGDTQEYQWTVARRVA
jgi:2-polyprenyl-3-methyl-5-hydroxy-6-metoxy-1,4-benzoquinol methylase